MKVFKRILLVALFGSTIQFMSCDANGDFLLFSIEDDKALGAQMAAQIADSPTEFPILSRAVYADAYDYLEEMILEILDNGDITFRDDFAWEVHIIDQDVLNAFVTPGGYIYVYNGLIQYLDNADDLAGVLGHEIAHADQRHSSKQLQRQYGIQLLLSLALGEDPSQMEQLVASVAGTLGTLAFSRGAEAEADDYSVQYLSNTRYACNGAASFFQKLKDEGQCSGFAFASTHPDPCNRVEDINAKATELSCSTNLYADSATSCTSTSGKEYQCFKEDMLPNL